MGIGIEVDPQEVRTRAVQLGAAADGIGGVDLPGPVGRIATSLPASASAGAATALASTWRTRADTLHTDVRTQAQAMNSAATTYTNTEFAIIGGFDISLIGRNG